MTRSQRRFGGSQARFAIVGGGIIGLSIGWRLAQAGASVDLYEADSVGAGASSAAAGMLSAVSDSSPTGSAFSRLCIESQKCWPAFVAELEAVSGIDVGHVQRGTLLIATSEAEAGALEARARSIGGEASGLALLDREEWRALEPGLGPNVLAAAHAQNDGQVDSRAVIAALRRAFLVSGGTLHERRRADRILMARGEVIGLSLADGIATADHVIVAAGAWAGSLAEASGLGDVFPTITPVKGQIAALDADPQSLPVRHVIRAGPTYVVPRANGRLIVGATSQEAGFDVAPSKAAAEELLKTAARLVPDLAGHPVSETWAGLRPSTASGFPVLGPTAIKGLSIALGHYRNGILLAPMTADLVAHAALGILRQREAVLLEPFAPTKSASTGSRIANSPNKNFTPL